MIRSMTGYGRAQDTLDGMNIQVELKSVNHRYFEFSARTPRAYGFLEEKLKSYVQSVISRGKVECYVYLESLEAEDAVVEVNHSLAAGYLNALKELSERYNLSNDISATSLSRYPDIFSIHRNEIDEEKIWNNVKTVAEKAVGSFVKMREVEGERLKDDVLNRLDVISGHVEFIEKRSPETVKEYNEKLLTRIKDLISDIHIDEQRILTEAAIFADKVAVAEETVRLNSHIKQLHDFMDSKEAIGRKIDFLVQEMNREANTIGSKAQDVEIAKHVIDIKAEIEKIREQIQNIE